MCNPGIAVMVAMGVMTAASGMYAADASKKAAQYTADVAKQNADLDDFRADQAGQLGAIREEQHRAKVRQLAGTQRANLAANGVDLGSGTALDMVTETYTMGEADALTIRFNAMNEAWGFRTQAINERNGGRFAKMQGHNQATGTYLSTAASIGSMFAGGMGGMAATTASGYGGGMAGSQMSGGGTGGGP